MAILEMLKGLWEATGFVKAGPSQWQNYIMIAISIVLFYLAVVKGFEPLLLLPIAFGMFIINIPGSYGVLYGIDHELSDIQVQEVLSGLDLDKDGMVGLVKCVAGTGENAGRYFTEAGELIQPRSVSYGLFHYLGMGVQYVIFPPIIFLGIGAMTDFGPLIANPKSLLMGAGAQLGVFLAFFGARALGFNAGESSAIGIIGGADGPMVLLASLKLLIPKSIRGKAIVREQRKSKITSKQKLVPE